MKKYICLIALFLSAPGPFPALAADASLDRERLRMDLGWRFALGHPSDTNKDFGHATGFFSYFAKAGYGDGPAASNFDDRGWRTLDLPHDWAVELPFDEKGSYSHGYKALGRNFPQNSVGWYRKTFSIPAEDRGKRINLEFDGVFRNAEVWVNGFYMGRQQSGYNNFRYDITDNLTFGGDNTVAVRVDATLEEGWFYEGAGIYRHVWLAKTAPLHVDYHGTFVSSEVRGSSAEITIRTTLVDEGPKASFGIEQEILDAEGKSVAKGGSNGLALEPGAAQEFPTKIKVSDPHLWSIDSPYLYKLVTRVLSGGKVVDRTETSFGIRTLTFDPDKGFFLNGKHLVLKGTCNHQDHAGVGAAMPDALQFFRVRRLKEMGSNAYRCAHNPPTPELLDACDQLGMLVLVENRLMGTSPEVLEGLKRIVLRDRNHPCVLAWSLGNEEWSLEGNEKGAQIAAPMQDFVKRLDPTRRVTAATSWWGKGISTVIDLVGYNYFDHGSTDDQHAKYPQQPGVGTEDSTTHQTRGIYEDGLQYGHQGPDDRKKEGAGIERVWKYYAARPYLAGLFLWTGFDYRGEETPFRYPAISSQYGILDLCGFPKDCYNYLKVWWDDKPALFLTPHWNWRGKEGKEIEVRAFSNCGEVELFLNGKSLGKKTMPALSHLEWKVPFKPGTLSAKGYQQGKVTAEAKWETTGIPALVALSSDRGSIQADGEDVAVVTVEARDKEGRPVATAGNEIQFTLKGPGRIIGVGNGDPTCHEADRYFETVTQVVIQDLKMRDGGPLGKRPEVEAGLDDSKWPVLFSGRADDQGKVSTETPKNRVVRGNFVLPRLGEYSEIILYPKSLLDAQAIFVNGHLIADKIGRDDKAAGYPIAKNILKAGRNTYAVVGKELLRRRTWEELNLDPGYIRAVVPAGQWKRSLFSGLAQVIVQSDRIPGTLTLKASSKGLASAEMELKSQEAAPRPSVP